MTKKAASGLCGLGSAGMVNSIKNERTEKVSEHVASGFCGLATINYPETREDPEFFNTLHLSSGPDCVNEFIHFIVNTTKTYFENADLDKPIFMTSRDYEHFYEASKYYICRDKFDERVVLSKKEVDYKAALRRGVDADKIDVSLAKTEVTDLALEWRKLCKKTDEESVERLDEITSKYNENDIRAFFF